MSLSGVPRILVINPGSTSTKVALYAGEEEVWRTEVSHAPQELADFPTIAAQLPLRMQDIDEAVQAHGLDVRTLSAVVGRGGLLLPVPGGTYRVDDALVEELLSAANGAHASNLGAPIALRIARAASCPAFIVDPVVTDELTEEARESGFPGLPRRSLLHALNQRAMAQRAARELGRPYRELRLVVAHIGGGISVGLHDHGRIVEVNNALDGDGPLAPERSGSLPLYRMWTLYKAGRFDLSAALGKISGKGGLVDLVGTQDLRRIPDQGKGSLARAALAVGIARECGRQAALAGWPVDALVLTGGAAHDAGLVRAVLRKVGFLAQRRFVYAGEAEMQALALGALRTLQGEEPTLDYTKCHA
ncbi:MAG: butyrate kinase [Thermaerobacter sp.]|nr:butyrate kinase [Thermaerobacter sp.]